MYWTPGPHLSSQDSAANRTKTLHAKSLYVGPSRPLCIHIRWSVKSDVRQTNRTQTSIGNDPTWQGLFSTHLFEALNPRLKVVDVSIILALQCVYVPHLPPFTAPPLYPHHAESAGLMHNWMQEEANRGSFCDFVSNGNQRPCSQ